jgi:ATP-dependent DNA helicase RecQ
VFTSVEGERQRFLRGLFDAAVKKRVWYELDAQAAAAATSSDRGRVVRALDWLAERGLIELQPRGVRHRYQRLRTPHEPRSTAASLQERMALREAAELERLARVLELTVQDACQIRAIGCYFGDVETTPCGHCSHCLSGRVTLPDRTHVEVDPGTMGAAADLASTYPEVLADPRAMTRFLCGLSSPGLTAARLTRHPLFGSLAEAPFAEVLTAVGGSQDAAC